MIVIGSLALGDYQPGKSDVDLLVLSDRSIDPEDPTLIDARDVTGQAKVTRLSRDLLVQGNVAANVRLTCSRCLEEFMLPVQGTLEEQYQPSVDVMTGRPVQRAGRRLARAGPADLNEGPHTHEIEVVDNRWAGLRELQLEEFPADNGQSKE